MIKRNKSALKRFKIGRQGIQRRPTGQNHFNARNTGQEGRRKKGYLTLPKNAEKQIRRILFCV